MRNVAAFGLVIVGASRTVRMNVCGVAAIVFVAVNVIEYVPPVPAAALPPSTPALNVTPVGRTPLSVNVGAGKPVAVGLNVPGVPTVKMVLAADVNAGASLTVNVNVCGADEPTLFVAVNVIEYVFPVPAFGVPESIWL